MKWINKFYILVFLQFIMTSSAQSSDRTVTILSQWHLVNSQKTIKVDESKKLAQYPNQKAIYLILDEWIRNKKLDLLVSEGCEGEINSNFKLNFNGWNYSSLSEVVISPSYPDILTLVPLKIEAKFKESIQTVCGDNQKLIKEHEMIFSDLRGLSGFLGRLREAKNTGDEEKFNAYKATYEEVVKKSITDPIAYIKKEMIKLIEQEKEVLEKRNKSFFEKVSRSKSKSAAIVIGHRHSSHLKDMFKMAGFTVITPQVLDSTLPKGDPMNEIKTLIQ